MTAYHLAQYNVAKMRAESDDPAMAGFLARLDELNHLADRSPGFVWRFQDETGHSNYIRLYEDDLVVVNMSTWESIDALHTFTYRSDHGPVYAARHTWFEPMDGHTLVLWWVAAGHEPTAMEGKDRLELLQRLGPTADAFTLKQRFPAPTS